MGGQYGGTMCRCITKLDYSPTYNYNYFTTKKIICAIASKAQ